MREVMYDKFRSWIEIDLQALRYNVTQFLQVLKSKDQFMAVVKANAYGHGAVRVSKELNAMGITNFAVATLSEAIELRENGILGDILILGYTNPSCAKYLYQYNLIQTILDYSYAQSLQKENISLRVHIAIDSGMHRLGESIEHIDSLVHICQFSHLQVEGIFSHLCVCDEQSQESQEYTYYQIEQFQQILNQLKDKGCLFKKVHLLSSYGLVNYQDYIYDYVRMGILMYGVDSCFPKQTIFDLKPVLSLKSKIAMIRDVKSHETIGYGRTYTTTKPMKIAVVPIGYADGLPREFSNQGQVIVRGKFVSVIGRICMDQMMIDVSDIKDIQNNDIVTIIGDKQGIEDIAKQVHTISNELLSQIGFRLPKIYK